MSFTLERIESLAPDQASLAAARKLLKPAGWPTLAAGEGMAWGECQGSGATPYRVVISEADAGYKCTCPSRKFPCKHSLALMWMRAEGKPAFLAAPVPEWVKEWLGRRRGPGVTGKATEENAGPKPSIALAGVAEEAVEIDPKAEARAAAARERNRTDREASIAAGLDELEVWVADQVERGVAGLVASGAQACKVIAQRMVDAKAQGLATRLESLPARLFSLAEAVRPAAAVAELGQMVLLAQAYRRQDELEAALRADMRQAVGWALTREALLANPEALRVAGSWRVVATLNEVQPDRLRRVETWLFREGVDGLPRFGLLLDFIPVATGAATSGYTVGDRVEAELVFYPSALPLRALVQAAGAAQASKDGLEIPAHTLGEAYANYELALGQVPWLGTWPLRFGEAWVRRSGEALFLCDAENGIALPLQAAQSSLALPLVAVGAFKGIGLWNGYALTLCWADTSLGRWVSA